MVKDSKEEGTTVGEVGNLSIIDAKEVEERLDKGEFHARTILEMVGKPANHVTDTLLQLLKKLSDEGRFKLVKVDVETPAPVEGPNGEKTELFTTFAEVEFVAKDMHELMNFVIDYTPASLEVLHPSSLTVQASYLSDVLTELVGRFHLIDQEFRKAAAKTRALSQSFNVITQNAILIYLNKREKTAEEISKVVGIVPDQITHYLNMLIEAKRLDYDETKKTYKILSSK